MKSAYSFFSHFSVKTKLAIGFASVISVGLTCMASGFFGAYTLSGLITQAGLVSEFKFKLEALRSAEQQYLLARDANSLGDRNTKESAAEAQLYLIQEKLSTDYDQQVAVLNQAWAKHDAAFQALFSSPNSGESASEQNNRDNFAGLDSALGSLQKLMQDSISNRILLVYVLLTATAGLAMLVSVVAVWLLSQQLVSGLKHLLAQARQIEAGDLREVRLNSRGDEIGQLQRATQAMSDGLRELVAQISQGAEQLAVASQHLAHESAEGRAELEAQTSEVEHVSVAMNQLVVTVQQIGRSTEEAAKTAFAADQKARDGNQVVGVVLNQIELLSQDMDELGEAMKHLQDGSERIGQVVNVIKDVADQTNLLALNAAIEAARAGEQGRGFAVVADEVRALAQRTQHSTSEIAELVLAIQKGGERTARVMNRSHQRTLDAVQQAESARAALNEINVSVATIQAMNQQIASAVEEQSAVADVVSGNVSKVRNMADRSSTKASRVLDAVRELAKLGEGLKGAVHRFRL
ncbi:methyl-accepting chemotaxis protein [Pseudomonas putida]|uniref:methyl-accepting chemotaxis protein n=2 Tax=Pseudomonas TaxID=286 RepID=UPI001C4D278A|nr:MULTISPECIES: methyl-accepting chemotaxis protein [Pseudomonas]MDH4846252.1 methyl-accepting chemotaxis protein [Pseudomonas sp. BN605]MDH4858541.1 methyl-accepting chemotaxis protein [Pseudomonas sp. BN505]NWL07979.1 hypothetical protein [Pseudomonas hunanensis]